jgi:predicted transcriptional regulator with HTH domain
MGVIGRCDMEEEDIDLGRVYHSFKKSESRSTVYFHLWDIRPKEENADEISKATGLSKKDVVGALEGGGSRYNDRYSLVGMDIVARKEEGIHGQIFVLYSARPLKFDMREELENYVKKVNPISIAQAEIKMILGKILKVKK